MLALALMFQTPHRSKTKRINVRLMNENCLKFPVELIPLSKGPDGVVQIYD